MTQRILDYGWAIGPHDATSGLLLQFSVTASRRWRVSAPGTSTGAHHHADTETAAYVLSGTVRIYFGNDFEEYLDASAGEFVFVPPRIPHIEINLSHEVATFVVARSSGEPMIIPIEADLSNLAHLRAERQREAAITP